LEQSITAGPGCQAFLNSGSGSGRHEYILAEFRCAFLKAKLAQLEIETIAIALKSHIVDPEQAVAMFWESHATQFLGLELGAEHHE
jgi:hypothetical protein